MDKIEKLKELKSLFESSIISKEEFEQLKNEIINQNISTGISQLKEVEIAQNNTVNYTKTPISDYFIIENPRDRFSQTQTFWLKENISLESSMPNNYLIVAGNINYNANIELSIGIEINNSGFNLIFDLAIVIYNNNKRIDDKIQLLAPMLSNAKINFIIDEQLNVLTLDNCTSYRLSPYDSCAENAQVTLESVTIIEQLARARSIEYEVTYSTNDYNNQRTSQGLFKKQDILKVQAFYNSFFDANFETAKILSRINDISSS